MPLTLDHSPEFTLVGMTNALHIPARADVPIACDMSTAEDTPDARLAEYGRLFERALVRRERREAACCPFLEFRVETVGDEVVYDVIWPAASAEQRAGVDAMLDALYALPDHAGSDMAGLLARLTDSGVDVIEAGDMRFEWNDPAARAAS